MKTPTLDEQLATFLDKWEVVRTAQLRKYQLVIDQLKDSPGFQGRWGAHHKVEHYQHELAMIQELRVRCLANAKSRRAPLISTGGTTLSTETEAVTARTAMPDCGSKVFDIHHAD